MLLKQEKRILEREDYLVNIPETKTETYLVSAPWIKICSRFSLEEKLHHSWNSLTKSMKIFCFWNLPSLTWSLLHFSIKQVALHHLYSFFRRIYFLSKKLFNVVKHIYHISKGPVKTLIPFVCASVRAKWNFLFKHLCLYLQKVEGPKRQKLIRDQCALGSSGWRPQSTSKG